MLERTLNVRCKQKEPLPDRFGKGHFSELVRLTWPSSPWRFGLQEPEQVSPWAVAFREV